MFTREEWESCEDLVKNIQVPTTLLKLDGAYKLIIHEIKETDILSKFNQTKIDFSRLDAVIIETEYILDFLDFNLDIKEIISKYMISNNEIAWLEHNILQVAEPYFGMQGCKWAY